MHAGQVIDLQADLIDRFTRPYFRQILKYTLNVDSPKRANLLIDVMEKHAQNAYAYHVNAEMSDLVLHAAHMLEDDDLVDLSLPPTQIGLVRFDKPLPLRDARGKVMLIHWMSWGPGTYETEDGHYESGILSTGWNDLEDPDEVAVAMFDLDSEANQKRFEEIGLRTRSMQTEHMDMFKAAMGRWSVIGTSMMFPGLALGGEYVQVGEEYAKQIEAEGDTPYGFTNTDRYLHALWLLMNQTIVTVEDEDLTGPFKRRAVRKNLPHRVTVIKLRRKAHPSVSNGESHVEWQHRWVTRGHWRWQPCGTGRNERRRIWINSYIKGPDDKPLVVSDKVYSLVR